MLRLALITLLLASCAAQNTFKGTRVSPKYPETTVSLTDGKRLIHLAGRPCSTDERPEVGVADAERTFSSWKVEAANGDLLCEAPSFLADPAFAGEFADHYRKEDSIEIFESASGRTILIVEDRSPTFPRKAYLLLSRQSAGDWKFSELLIQSNQGIDEWRKQGHQYAGYPAVLSLSDDSVVVDDLGETRRLLFTQIKKRV